MKKGLKYIIFLCAAALVVAICVWGPEALTGYRDRQMLGEIHVQPVEEAGEGYRYKLGSNERLYILAECLNSQKVPESEQGTGLGEAGDNSGSLMGNPAVNAAYGQLGGTYAFVVNHRGPSEKEYTWEEIFPACTKGLEELKKLGVLPASVKEVSPEEYDAALYSAIDVLEPRNNVAVWKVSLADRQKNTDRNNRLIDAYLDADSGKIYEFYVRTARTWEEIDPDALVESWRQYMGLREPKPYDSDNPLLETTPYFKKYVFDGMENDKTIVTVGFYEGINELFLKISQ